VGIVTTAARADRASAEILQPSVECMAQLNDRASAAMLEAGAHAATDITGFGLVGHAHTVAAASACALQIRVSSVPLVPGLAELLPQRTFPGGLWRNYEYYGEFMRVADGVDEDLVYVLCDPQTSGGLLIAVPDERADGLMSDLAGRGVEGAARIGQVIEGPAATVHLLP
jgi:selenide,water dikinase